VTVREHNICDDRFNIFFPNSMNIHRQSLSNKLILGFNSFHLLTSDTIHFTHINCKLLWKCQLCIEGLIVAKKHTESKDHLSDFYKFYKKKIFNIVNTQEITLWYILKIWFHQLYFHFYLSIFQFFTTMWQLLTWVTWVLYIV